MTSSTIHFDSTDQPLFLLPRLHCIGHLETNENRVVMECPHGAHVLVGANSRSPEKKAPFRALEYFWLCPTLRMLSLVGICHKIDLGYHVNMSCSLSLSLSLRLSTESLMLKAHCGTNRVKSCYTSIGPK